MPDSSSMGAGYDIPISVSASDSTALNPNFNAGTTNFDLGSGSLYGGSNDVTSRASNAATATAATAQGGNAGASTGAQATNLGSGVGGGSGAPAAGGLSTTTLLLIIGGMLGLVFLLKRK